MQHVYFFETNYQCTGKKLKNRRNNLVFYALEFPFYILSTRFESNFAQNRRISLSVNYFFKTNLEWLGSIFYVFDRDHNFSDSQFLRIQQKRWLIANQLFWWNTKNKILKLWVLFHMSAKSNFWMMYDIFTRSKEKVYRRFFFTTKLFIKYPCILPRSSKQLQIIKSAILKKEKRQLQDINVSVNQRFIIY